MNSEQQYIDLFAAQQQLIESHSTQPMNAVRQQAFNDFCRLGFPSKKQERYRYTDMARLFQPDYGLNLSRINIPVNPYDAFRCDVPNLSTSLYFVVNDQFFNHLPATRPPLPPGVIIDSIAHVALTQPQLIGSHYARLAPTADDGITALNTMLAQDGLFIFVPRHTVVDRTIQVVNILKSPFPSRASHHPVEAATPNSRPGLMVNRRVLIVMEEGAQAKLLFCDHTADDAPFLATQVVEAHVGAAARLDLYCLEETHQRHVRVSNLFARQQRDSRLNHHVITLVGGTTRNRTDIMLAEEGAECTLGGCAIGDRSQHIDNNTLITHDAPHCLSRQLYKYVLDEKSTGAFAGRILVNPGAQKTEANMTNQNLLATREARMFTQPMLEIYADDVKCAHGSTVGQLNDAALFYMRQRGISLAEARLLLQTAFVGEAINQIALEPLRNRLHYLVEKRFRGDLGLCRSCSSCR